MFDVKASRLLLNVERGGRYKLGSNVITQAYPLRCRLSIRSGASLVIGRRVYLGPGVDICATKEVVVEDDVFIGPYAIVMDSDFHVLGLSSDNPQPSPVYIGSRTHVGAYAIVLKGAHIGDNVVIAPGSVVSGYVESGVTVSGCPARPINR